MTISAGGESKRARQFCLLRFYHSIFTDWVSGGGRGADGSLLSAVVVWYACQRIERAIAWNIFPFALPLFRFHRLGGGDKKVPAALTLSGGALSMLANGSGMKSRGTFYVSFLVVQFLLNARWGVIFSAYLNSRRRCVWYACQRVGK